MFKTYLSRAETKRGLMLDIPIGDPFGGAAHGEKNDPVTAIAGGGVVSAVLGKKASDKASRASTAATDRTIEEQSRQFDLQREDTAPYREAGARALNVLEGGIKDMGQPLPQYSAAPSFAFDESRLSSSPAYQFQLEQGMNAVNRGAAKGGNLGSGNRLLELQRMGQGLAAQSYGDEFSRQFATNQDAYNRNLQGFNIGYQQNQDMYGRGQNYLNRLSGLAGIGQAGVAQSGAAGANMAGQIGIASRANAGMQAGAAEMKYDALSNAIRGGVQNYMLYDYMRPQQAAASGFNPAVQMNW